MANDIDPLTVRAEFRGQRLGGVACDREAAALLWAIEGEGGDAPYGTERSYNALRLAGALGTREGEAVRIFPTGDSDDCAKAH